MKAFNIDFDNLTINQVLDKIKHLLKEEKQSYIVLPYSEFVVRAQKDKEFLNILNKADLCLCESRGLLLILGLLGYKLKENIYGVDLINSISKFKNIFLLGGTHDTIKKTAKELNAIGFEHGYQDLEKVIDKINEKKPEILLVGLGSPKQEKWIYSNLKKMPSVKIAIGVGGAFDFISQSIKRSPKILQNIGLEWLWRLIIQPKRFKRIFTGVFGLLFLSLKEKLKN
ncbi:MAG: WecB/TagA/CpsF family glycosyltransferase [Patescibacteria group bacterium]